LTVKRVLAIVCGLLVLCRFSDARAERSPDSILGENKAAIVYIDIAPAPNSLDKPARGTGFLIGGDGFVLAAQHTLKAFKDQASTPISVHIGSVDAPGLPAEIINVAMATPIDVGVLKIKGQGATRPNVYETTGRGDSSTLKIGDRLYIVGFNTHSNISLQQGTLSSFESRIGGPLLWELTAPGVFWGMSGAPVFNSDGMVIGIVKAGLPGTSIVMVYRETLLEQFAAAAGWQRGVFRRFKLYKERALWDPDLDIVFVETFETCARQCSNDSRCKAFSFFATGRACFLKSEYSNFIKRAHSLSGVLESLPQPATD
jgi:S1-C subfamily serine protease